MPILENYSLREANLRSQELYSFVKNGGKHGDVPIYLNILHYLELEVPIYSVIRHEYILPKLQ